MGIVHTRGFRPHVYRESEWYWPIAEHLARFDDRQDFPSPEDLSGLYAQQNGAVELPALRFVRAGKSKRRRGTLVQVSELYEGRIVEKGEVPTRPDDWHDLFNALAFMTFPRAKRALHARQYELWRSRIGPSTRRLPNARTREQDALALFDEGGLCVVAPPARAASLHEASEQALAEASREPGVYVVPFGHALYEHLVAGLPCPLATAHVIELEHTCRTARSLLSEVDSRLAAALSSASEFCEPSRARGSSLAALCAHRPAE